MADEILFGVGDDGVGHLVINRPSARNALNLAAQDAFAAAVRQASNRPDLRVLIINGAGDKAFASGGDMKELIDCPDAESARRLQTVMGEALAGLQALPLPVIAAVNGDAIGGGCEILSACDLRIASEKATFGYAQVQVGLTTGWGGTARLISQVGRSRAMELLLTGRRFAAREALSMGLIHRLVPADTPVLVSADGWARELLRLPRNALAAIKALVWQTSPADVDASAKLEATQFVRLWTETDHLEAMAAFVEKRPPRFNWERD